VIKILFAHTEKNIVVAWSLSLYRHQIFYSLVLNSNFD
jgi:hypothetical protein